jgi:hypothetical protein
MFGKFVVVANNKKISSVKDLRERERKRKKSVKKKEREGERKE